MYEQLENEYVLNFKKQLNCHDLLELSQFLQEEKSVIAGSYVLQSVMNASWANDIDIWCENPDMKSVMEHFRAMGYVLTSFKDNSIFAEMNSKEVENANLLLENRYNIISQDNLNKIERFKERAEDRIADYKDEIVNEYHRLERYINTIYNFTHETKPPIQFIETKGSVTSCIDTFDFNICRIYYDGENVFVKEKDKFLKSIRNRICQITKEAVAEQSKTEWFRTLSRAIKYTQRNFFIDFRFGYEKIAEFARTDVGDVWHSRFMQLWNYSILLSYGRQIPKSYLLPYFHSYYGTEDFELDTRVRRRGPFRITESYIKDEKNRNTIFGYNISPNNTLPQEIKRITKFRIFDVHNKVIPDIEYITKEDAKKRDYQDKIVDVNLPRDIKKTMTDLEHDVYTSDKKEDFCDLLTLYAILNCKTEKQNKVVIFQSILEYKISLPKIDKLKSLISNFDANEERTEQECIEMISIIAEYLKHYGCKKEYTEVNTILDTVNDFKNRSISRLEPFRTEIHYLENNSVIQIDKYHGFIVPPIYFLKVDDLLYKARLDDDVFIGTETVRLDDVYYEYIANRYTYQTYKNNKIEIDRMKKQKIELDKNVENVILQQIYKKIRLDIKDLQYITFYKTYIKMFKRKKPSELTEEDIERLKKRLMGIEEKEREEKDSDDDDSNNDNDSKYSNDGSIRSHENLFESRPGFERPPMPVRSRADDERFMFPGLDRFIERNERIGRERIMQIYRRLVDTGEIDLEEHDPEFRLNILQDAIDDLGIPDVEVEDGFEIPVLRREPDRVARLFADLDERYGLDEEEFRNMYTDFSNSLMINEEMDDDEIIRRIENALNEQEEEEND